MSSDRPDSSPPDDPDHGLDIDAAFAEIVAHWDLTPADEPPEREPNELQSNEPQSHEPQSNEPQSHEPQSNEPQSNESQSKEPRRGDGARERDAPPSAEELRQLFRPAWDDPLQSPARWDDEGHFVPPTPPPIPRMAPRRRLAWAALLGSPVVALLLVVLDVSLPGWVALLVAGAFVGGFGYLVATMRSGPPDDLSGDNGAVV